jgi:serine/threonine protein phosphatase 1
MKTREGLDALTREERIDFVDWVDGLPLYAHVNVADRSYLLVHAGIRKAHFTSHSRWSDATMDKLLSYQSKEDLLWIRDDFWGQPTGLINERGEGPIVIAGHTPVPYIPEYTKDYDREPRDEDGQCKIMHLGACDATGQVADRWAIDCGAAGSVGWGGIGIVRLDDGYEEYTYVEEGE